MAKKNCRPYPSPRLVQRTERENPGSVLVGVVKKAVDDFRVPMLDADAAAQQREYLEKFMPGGFDQVVDFFEKEGVIQLKTLDDGAVIPVGGSRAKFGDITKISNMTSAAVTYMQATGGGLQQLANNFIAKVDNGADALADGLKLAEQMSSVSRLGGTILGVQQKLGLGVRYQRNFLGAEMGDEGMEALQRTFRRRLADGTVEEVSALDRALAAPSEMQQIAAKLNGGKQSQAEALEMLYDLARRLRVTSNPMEAFRITSTIDAAGGMWREVWINGLLSAPRTVVSNVWGVTWAISRPMMQLVPAALTQQTAKALGMSALEATSERVAAEASARLTQMYMALGDATVLAWKAIKSERDIYKPVAGRSELVLGGRISGQTVNDALERSALEGGTLGRLAGGRSLDRDWMGVIDRIGQVIRMPSRLMLGTDTFIKHLTIRGEVGAEAVRKAMQQNIDPGNREAYQAFLQREMKAAFNMDSDPKAMERWALDPRWEGTQRAITEANISTFQQENPAATAVRQMIDKAPYLRPFVPFIKTPMNILSSGIESTGIPAALKAAGIVTKNATNPVAMKLALVEELSKDPTKSFQLAGQMAVMSGLAALVYQQVISGRMEAGGPGRWAPGGKYSEAQKNFMQSLQERGRIPYGIEVGGTSVPLDQLVGEPFGIWMRMVADAAYLSSHMSQVEQDEAMGAIVMMSIGGLTNATFLTGIEDLLAVVTGGTEGVRLVPTLAQNWVSTQTPFGGLLNYVKNISDDPYRRIYWNDNLRDTMAVVEDTLGQSLFGKMADRLPGVSKAPVMIDQIYGRPVPLLPGQGRYGLNPLQQAIPMLPRGVTGGDGIWSQIQAFRPGYREAKVGLHKYATDDEQQKFNGLMSQVTVNGLTIRQAIAQFMSRSDVQEFMQNKRLYKPGGRTQLEIEFDSIKNAYADQAEMRMMELDPRYARRVAIMNAAKQAYKNNDLQTARQYERQLEQLKRELEVERGRLQ